VSTKAETEEVYSLEGNITYRTDTWLNSNVSTEEWKILYNISIPIKLYGGDELYWYQDYGYECDVLTILYQYGGIQSMITFGYINPGEPHDICENTKKYTIPNDSFGGNDTYVIIKRHPTLRSYDHHLTWEFWIERDIVEASPNNETIGINIMPFLIGFMCISVILIYQRLRKLK